MGSPNPDAPRGIFASVKALLGRLLALLHGRAELFTTELEEEITRLVGVLIWSLVGILCAIIGLSFLAVTILLAVPGDARTWVAGGLTLLFFAIAALGGLSIKKIVRAKTRIFDASLKELEKDRERLRGEH